MSLTPRGNQNGLGRCRDPSSRSSQVCLMRNAMPPPQYDENDSNASYRAFPASVPASHPPDHGPLTARVRQSATSGLCPFHCRRRQAGPMWLVLRFHLAAHLPKVLDSSTGKSSNLTGTFVNEMRNPPATMESTWKKRCNSIRSHKWTWEQRLSKLIVSWVHPLISAVR